MQCQNYINNMLQIISSNETKFNEVAPSLDLRGYPSKNSIQMENMKYNTNTTTSE